MLSFPFLIAYPLFDLKTNEYKSLYSLFLTMILNLYNAMILKFFARQHHYS